MVGRRPTPGAGPPVHWSSCAMRRDLAPDVDVGCLGRALLREREAPIAVLRGFAHPAGACTRSAGCVLPACGGERSEDRRFVGSGGEVAEAPALVLGATDMRRAASQGRGARAARVRDRGQRQCGARCIERECVRPFVARLAATVRRRADEAERVSTQECRGRRELELGTLSGQREAELDIGQDECVSKAVRALQGRPAVRRPSGPGPICELWTISAPAPVPWVCWRGTPPAGSIPGQKWEGCCPSKCTGKTGLPASGRGEIHDAARHYSERWPSGNFQAHQL